MPSAPPPPSDISEPAPKSVEQELEEWKEARRIKKRSFREPWRTVSIVAGIALAPTSFMAPPGVAAIADVALGVLTLGSLYAGWRGRKTPTGS
jgi:hypothetical protein